MDHTRRGIYFSGNTMTGDIYNEMGNNSNISEEINTLYGFFEVPENIVGRYDTTEKLFTLSKDHRRILITGIGGAGKTSQALHCATIWVPKYFTHAAFMNMETKQTAKASFLGLAQRLKLLKNNMEENMHQIVRDIYDYFKNRSLLIIFDNIEPIKYNISKYLPAITRKNILVLGTSQYTELKTMFHCYELELISEKAGVCLVNSLFQGYDFECIKQERKEIVQLVRKLECLPLALLHAAALIRDQILYQNKKYTIKDYLKVYSEKFNETFPPEYDNRYKRTVYTALKLNIDKSIENNHAERILSCMAFMNPSDIKADVFVNLSNVTHENLVVANRELSKYSIITNEERKPWYSKTKDKYIKIHRTVLEVYRSCIKGATDTDNILLMMFELLSKTDKTYSHYEFLLPHMSETLITEGYKIIFSSGQMFKYLTEDLLRVDCNITATENWRALHYAEYCSDSHIITELESRDGSLSSTADNWSPLHAAMLNGKDSVATSRLITKYKDMLNLQTDSGLSALHIAAATGSKGSVQRLLDCKCEVNLVDKAGNTAGHWAMQYVCYDIVLKLIDNGMRVNSANNEGNTMLHITATHCNKQSDLDSSLCASCKSTYNVLEEDQNKLMQKLIDHGADVNLLNKQGNAPIHLAAMNNQNNVALKLVSNGANITLPNYTGDTPLLIAADKEFNNVVDTLAKGRADTDITDFIKDTPLHKIISKDDKKLTELSILLGDTFNSAGDPTLLDLIKNNRFLTETKDYNIDGHTFSFLSEKIWIGMQTTYEAREGFYINKLVKIEDGINLIKTISPSNMVPAEPHIKQLIDSFQNIPLAFHLAVAYCKNENTTIEGLLNFITHAPNSREYELFMKSSFFTGDYNVIKLICVIISIIREKEPQAFELLCFIAYLTPGFRDISALYRSYKIGDNVENNLSKILVKHGLLEAYDEENDTIQINSLVRSITRLYVNKYAIPFIFQSIYDSKDPEAISFILKYIEIDDIARYYKNNQYFKDSLLDKFGAHFRNMNELHRWTVLHHAVADSNPNAWQIVDKLINLGVNVNISIGGVTPLQLAAIGHREDNVFRELVKAGADINVNANAGDTTLYL